MKNLELLIEEILLHEAELKGSQFKEVSRFKSGQLTYTVKMHKTRISVETGDNKFLEVDAVIPDISITLLSSHKREMGVNRDYNKDEPAYQRKIRDTMWKTFDRMYTVLTPEEIEKYGSRDSMPQLLDVLRKYLRKYDTEYILSKPYGDNFVKRLHFYNIVLKRLGYTPIASTENGKDMLYGKKDDKNITRVLGYRDPSLKGKVDELTPDAVKSMKAIKSNL